MPVYPVYLFLNTTPLPSRNKPLLSSSPFKRLPDQLQRWCVCLVPWQRWWFHGCLHVFELLKLYIHTAFVYQLYLNKSLKYATVRDSAESITFYTSNCVFLRIPHLTFSFVWLSSAFGLQINISNTESSLPFSELGPLYITVNPFSKNKQTNKNEVSWPFPA